MIPNLADLDERIHSEALNAKVNAEFSGSEWRATPLDLVPKTLPRIFVVTHVERRYAPGALFSGEATFSLWRAIFTAVGATVAETRWALLKVSAAVNEQPVTVNGRPTTPLEFQLNESPSLDDGRYSARSEWHYALL